MLSTPPFSERDLTSAYAAHYQVKTIGDLCGLGSPLLGRISIAAGSVSADDFNLRVLFEPRLDRFRSAIWQEVDHSMLFSIDKHRTKRLPSFVEPIIDSYYTYRSHGTQWSGTQTVSRPVYSRADLELTVLVKRTQKNKNP